MGLKIQTECKYLYTIFIALIDTQKFNLGPGTYDIKGISPTGDYFNSKTPG